MSDAKFLAALNGLLKASAQNERKEEMEAYSTCDRLGKEIVEGATPARVKLLIQALLPLHKESFAKVFILSALSYVGDPSEVTPYFMKEVVGAKVPSYEMYQSVSYVARQYLLRSSDQRAVDYLLEQLTSPKGDRVMKEDAYWHVAGTGGEKGARVILAIRRRRTLLRPLSDRVLSGFVNAGEFGGKTKLVAERKDPKGRTWGLLENGALGNITDLWLVQKTKGIWTNPFFMRVSVVTDANAENRPKSAGKAHLTGGELLLKSNWPSALTAVPDSGLPMSRDGLTGEERARLGLPGTSFDSDGDGDPDALDPWPNAPNRSLTEDEQVLNAAFEARFHFNKSEGPMIFEALADMKPFEMVGRKGWTMWEKPNDGERFKNLKSCFGLGVGYISFSPFEEDTSKPWQKRLILWNADHTEAQIEIATVYGGLNATGYHAILRKFDGQWVVAHMWMTWIS